MQRRTQQRVKGYAAPRQNPVQGGRAQRVVSMLQKSEMKQPPRKIASPGDLVHYALYEYIGKRATETFLAVYMNVQNVVVGFSEYSMGSTTQVAVEPAGIFRDALLAGAQGIITVHQHPSGEARPSDADEAMWARLTAIGEILSIPVVDNLVLGEDEFYSEAQNMRTTYMSLRLTKP